jgi:hypothetical protein
MQDGEESDLGRICEATSSLSVKAIIKAIAPVFAG